MDSLGEIGRIGEFVGIFKDSGVLLLSAFSEIFGGESAEGLNDGGTIDHTTNHVAQFSFESDATCLNAHALSY